MTIVRESNVSFNRWPDFIRAVKQMVDTGAYEQLANIHGFPLTDEDGFLYAKHRMHGNGYGPVGFRRFLPWHRAYLIMFERELREIDDTLSLPYWDWDNDLGRLVGVSNYMAIATNRNLGLLPGVEPVQLLPGVDTPSQVRWFSDEQKTIDFEEFTGAYYTFTRALETSIPGVIVGQHGAGHRWVGGDMANTTISPRDIIFWMHHAAIDRVWAKWQKVNSGETAFLSSKEAKLDPWGNEFNILNINDISNLGDDSYSYIEPDRTLQTS